MLVADRLSERTLLTLFLIPVTILAVAGIVANAILPTLIAEVPAPRVRGCSWAPRRCTSAR